MIATDVANLTAELATYHKYPVAIARGQGCRVYDNAGREYLDFYGGHAVCLVGHCHPQVVAAVREQAGRLLFYSNICHLPERARLAERLVRGAPEGIGRVFFCNSGSEANETALKMARKYTGKPEILAFRESFHGRTMAALGATGLSGYHQFEPRMPGYRHVPFGDLAAVEEAIGPRTAGLIVEMIPSIGGVLVTDPAFFRGLRDLCDRHGLVLVADEVQTGLGRTGTELWHSLKVGLRPDLMTSAKALAGGLPMAAVLVSEAIAATIREGEHGTTFGGGPVPVAAANAVLDVIADEGLPERAERLGRLLRAALADLPGVTAVRGEGLLIGVDMEKPAGAVVRLGWERGVILGTSHRPHTARIIPPLTISAADAAEFVERFEELLA